MPTSFDLRLTDTTLTWLRTSQLQWDIRRNEEGNVPTLRVVDGEPVITDPSNFRSVAMLCTNIVCSRRSDCLRSIGNPNSVGTPTKENKFHSTEHGCEYFVPRTPEYINQLRERGVNRLGSAWNS